MAEPKKMHIRDAPAGLAMGIEAMMQQAFLCLVHQTGGVFRLPVATVDSLPRGKRMDMVMENGEHGPVFVFRVRENT